MKAESALFFTCAALLLAATTLHAQVPDGPLSLAFNVVGFEVAKTDPLATQAAQGDAALTAQMLLAQAARGAVKIPVMRSIVTLSGDRAKCGEAPDVLEVEPVLTSDFKTCKVMLALHQGGKQLQQLDAEVTAGGTLFLGQMEGSAAGRTILVLAHFYIQPFRATAP